MDTDAAVRLAIPLTDRQRAAVRAALRQVQFDRKEYPRAWRIEAEDDPRLTPADLERLVHLFETAAEVQVFTASVPAIASDDTLQQLVREAYEHFTNHESPVDLRDWVKAAEPFVRR